jgi:type IV fimbrial biogenesis protein FimT
MSTILLMKYSQAGLSMLECLVALAVMAILTVLAEPGFRDLLVRRSVLVTAEALVGDLRFARSEAIKRGTQVSMCRSANGSACSPAGHWVEGWIVFVDRNTKGVVDPGDEVLRVQSRQPQLESIASDNRTTDKASFSFLPTGMSGPATQTFKLTPVAPVPSNSLRVVCVSSQGRPRLAPPGADSCS